MSVNLLIQVQQSLGYPALQKIDPNKDSNSSAAVAETPVFSQAAIPAVLTAMYKYVQSDEGANDFLRGDISTNWVGKIFHDSHHDAVAEIKSYAVNGVDDATARLNAIAAEAIKTVKQQLPENAGIKEVKSFFLNQRNNILPYLPAELHLGDLLNDDTIDDNVNKMEGPISSLIKGIGSAFSNPVTGEEVKR